MNETASIKAPFQLRSLDDLLTREECAEWLKVGTQFLAVDAMDSGKIPVFKPSRNVARYHPRTILAKLAFDSGVPLEVVAAGFGISLPQQQKTT